MIAIIAKKLALGKREEEEVGLKSFHSNVARWRDEGRKEGEIFSTVIHWTSRTDSG